MLDEILHRNAHHRVVVHMHHRWPGNPEIRRGISDTAEFLVVGTAGVEQARSDLRTVSLLLIQRINYSGALCKKDCHVEPDVLF